MTTLAPATDTLIDLALAEDLPSGDITTDPLFDDSRWGRAQIVTRQPAVISGLTVASKIFEKVDARIRITPFVEDGDPVPSRAPLLAVEGPVASLLKAERLALNFLQHLTGIATLTYQFVGSVSVHGTQVAHTRKTLPGLRNLEIEAVLHGGGMLHRKSLSHAVLVKDNHIQAMGGIRPAVEKLRETLGHEMPIEVECDTLAQVDEALASGVERILLDNMDIATLEQAVRRGKGKAILEASGGITLRNAEAIAKTGVDIISTSEITMSAPAADIGMDFD